MSSSFDLQSIELPHPHIQTSLTEVTHQLPLRPPCRILFKNELEQPSGSFKLRGIGHLIQKSIVAANKTRSNREIHVFASSGGNAGLAAAYSAYFYKVKCTVVLPVISKPAVREKLKSYNANIILFGNTINEADKHLKNLINSIDTNVTTPIYCHPFNNPLIWEGHATLVDEVVEQLPKSERAHIKGMVCSCGGGGLYNGIYDGMKRNNIVDSEILLIETSQAPTLSESVKADKLITLNSVNSMATSLACSYTTTQTLNNYKSVSEGITTKLELIDDVDALKACIQYNANFSKVVEPACGAALSVVYNKLDLLYKNFSHLKEDDIVVVVVCGGSCTTLKDLAGFRKLVARQDSRL
ncbi:tryptophan synthase beta subunit-like PLP-dependent enzyme [Scheffersomyces xylosifermentans]|uniref:tryptophan synthase beta subunit-like PLP-dependent enzyme n=1 Tax=Scheffersomyces xylosifermentans TaxID=1304137 RepID=UPI00315CFD09